MYLINSIYKATEGEGVHVGTPQIFVRYQGCAIGCVNCDSKDTWDFEQVPPATLGEVLQQINLHAYRGQVPLRRVSITGGDPLHPKFEAGLVTLLKVLKDEKFYVNLEAAGTRIVPSIFELVDFISFDLKTPSTQVQTPLKHIVTLAKNYAGKFQIKAVVADKIDFDYAMNAYQWLKKELGEIDFPWCLTPVYNPGESLARENFVEILHHNESLGSPFRVIGQQHKWVFGPDAKQV
jgi:7-carboxy-7-deazaguanine synthase